MSKIVLILLAMLIALGLTLSVLGSGGEYAAERLYYRAAKEMQKIAVNPDVVPPAMVANVEQMLKNVLSGYPETDTAKSTNLTLADFYIKHKKFQEADAIIESMLGSKNASRSMLSSAQFLKGAIYEKQDMWDRALKEYIKLRDSYPDTKLGMQVPMYIAKHYSQNGTEEAGKAYDEAARYYAKLAKEYKGKPLGYEATNILLSIHFGMKHFDKVADIMEDAIDTYPLQLVLPQYMPYVEFVLVKQLKNPGRAILVYEKVMNKTNDEKIKKALQGRIDFLNKQK